ncbi:MAG: cytosine permease, partial [bacterium]|nr:cytosine permease [bacterium]
MLPDYIRKTPPNPSSNRAPWYVNTAPAYAGIFLWVAFYQQIGVGTLSHAGPWLCLAALVVAGLLSYGLYYYVPAMLGMKTGYPLYVVGSSTFGTAGGYVMPGLLMGLLQVGWYSASTFFATKYILQGVGADATPMTPLFIAVAVVWGYVMAYVGVKGIQYVAKIATYLAIVPFLMILLVFWNTAGGISKFEPEAPDPFVGVTMILAAVIGFFATAGAAGADFGMNNRNSGDVKWGGLVGIALAIIYAGGLPLLAVAGAHGLDSNLASFQFDSVIGSIGGMLSSSMFILFALVSIPSACFCAFIAGNSFSTMIKSVPRMGSTMIGVTIAIALAITGVAENLIALFVIVGASFGPICGAMAADYMLSGGKWAGPRKGVNIAGYGAWAVGFLIGILPFLPVPAQLQRLAQSAVLYSFVAGFAVYWILAKIGLEPETVKI